MAESIFPFIQDTAAADPDQNQELSVPREYAWDFNNDCFRMIDGKLSVVTELEAVRIWAMKALRTTRFRYLAYSWNYGNDLENLTGQGLSREIAWSEAMRYTREALLSNSYILEVKDFNVDLSDSILRVECALITPYGEVEISV
ncbi:MAG: hypothetical protein APF84_05820 [Gracilibacter sp. BRH_c7a]|nr:MAG: hypothetical protein APF84_05820 [Gracilibacter sp. BRH_c7a]